MSKSNDVEAVKELQKAYNELKSEIGKVIVGQEAIVREVLISIFSNGHCLLVGVPGLAKTLLVNTVSSALGLKTKRIQFTPDLMPSDIIGTEILDNKKEFVFIKGPLFANFVLADEINRTPPKTQSALLEAMQERSVTAAGKVYKLDEPFFVLATQNPIEQEGTYPLPEAQLDRFMFSLFLDYPAFEEELEIVKTTTTGKKQKVNAVLTPEEIMSYQKLIQKIPVNDSVLEFAVRLVNRTRAKSPYALPVTKEFLNWGAGPRASQYLIIAAKTHAVLMGKFSPDVEDVIAVAKPVLRHRIVKNYKAEAEGLTEDDIIEKLIEAQ